MSGNIGTTSAQDRLSQLFANSPLPPAPTFGQPCFSEKELEDKKAKEGQTWKVPLTAEYPRQIKSPQKQEYQRDIDNLTSSDDDDYVSSFKQKPSMKVPTKKSHRQAMPEAKGSIEYLEKGKYSKHNTSKPVAERSDSDDDRVTTANHKGSPVTGQFCQFNLAAKFPYKYMNDTNDRVSRHFFASNKFYNRTWDLHYLHPPFTLGTKPIILVPFTQVQQLITEIGQTFEIAVSVPKSPFTFTFYADGTPQPVFLGKSRSRDDANNLQTNIPAASLDHGECPPDASPAVKQDFEDFKKKCQAAISGKGKSKGAEGKKKREDDRLLAIKDWYAQLRRATRYLGLRCKTGHVQYPDPGLSWDEQEQFRQQQLKNAHFVLNPLDLNERAPFPFEKETVIIAIDVEAYERAHNLITEIGISTLDTLDLVGIPPGPNGKNWIDQIRSRHFRISGRESLVNREFCIGHPDAFQFGKSEWVDLKEAVAKVDSCFEWPFSVQYKHVSLTDQWNVEPANSVQENSVQRVVSNDFGGVSTGPTNAQQDAASRAAIASVLNGIGNKEAINQAVELTKANTPHLERVQRGPRDRNVILVGHDLRADVDYLRDLGSQIFAPSRATYPIAAMDIMANGEGYAKTLASIIDSMDTAPLYRVLTEETQNRNLASIMRDLGLPCYFPHNGGNDARYTLEAWVAMLVKARLKGDNEQKKEDKKAEKQQQAVRNNDPWNQGSEWSVDAGRPSTPDGSKGKKEDLDAFEAAIMASSPEASPPRQKDESIAALAERLKLDPTVDHEEPKSRFR